MFKDILLAQQLERTEGTVAASFVDARQRLMPERGSEWRDSGGTIVLYDGLESPMTQTFGLGLHTTTTPEQLDEIETFFRDRGAPVQHELSPLAGVATTALLVSRGYVPIEHSSVMMQLLDGIEEAPPAAGLRVRVMEEADRPAWIDAAVGGWGEAVPGDMMREISTLASHNASMVHVLVELEGRIVSTGSLGVCGKVALLAGASTIPTARGRGAQAAALAARFVEARRRGCTMAMIVAEPGSTSQRNAERRGFVIAYTRTKWQLATQ